MKFYSHTLFCEDSTDSGGGADEWPVRFSGMQGKICLLTSETGVAREWHTMLPVFCEEMAAAFPSLDWAFAAARSARFEHRQRPRIPAPGEGEIGGAK